jgi:hypothetical protein
MLFTPIESWRVFEIVHFLIFLKQVFSGISQCVKIRRKIIVHGVKVRKIAFLIKSWSVIGSWCLPASDWTACQVPWRPDWRAGMPMLTLNEWQTWPVSQTCWDRRGTDLKENLRFYYILYYIYHLFYIFYIYLNLLRPPRNRSETKGLKPEVNVRI